MYQEGLEVYQHSLISRPRCVLLPCQIRHVSPHTSPKTRVLQVLPGTGMEDAHKRPAVGQVQTVSWALHYDDTGPPCTRTMCSGIWHSSVWHANLTCEPQRFCPSPVCYGGSHVITETKWMPKRLLKDSITRELPTHLLISESKRIRSRTRN